MRLPLVYEDIVEILPHRYPFLFVDRIIELELWKRAVGIKNVTSNEYFFKGHFPKRPIMPGVLIVEALAQVGGVLAILSIRENSEKKEISELYFMSIDKVKFRRPVVPGDILTLEVEALRTGSKVWRLQGRATVGDELAAEALITASLGS